MNPRIPEDEELLQLLVFSDSEDSKQPWGALAEEFPAAGISLTRQVPDYRLLLERQNYDVVIFNCQPEWLLQSLLIHELKLQENTPGIIVACGEAPSLVVAALYDIGCHRVVLHHAGRMAELAQAVRDCLRMRKAEEAHEKTRARLTEINSMLEEKNRRLDEFSMTIAHDIRGPLGAISMKLEYVLDNYSEKLEGRPRNLMQKALESAKRLTDIVQAMYEYARLGAKAAKMQEVSLEQLVREAVSDLNFDESLDITIGIADLPHVWGNPELLRRVFINLISNAVKYSDKKNIVINIGCDRKYQRTIAEFCDVFVEDNGPGIEEKHLAGLFAMFSRGAGGSRDGLGIGLAVVQRIVELHYGSVSVSSQLGHGTKFTLCLPLERVNILG